MRSAQVILHGLRGSRSHLAACGSSISASMTWETSRQLCCCLDGQSRKQDMTEDTAQGYEHDVQEACLRIQLHVAKSCIVGVK